MSRLVPFCPVVSLSLEAERCEAVSTPDGAFEGGTPAPCECEFWAVTGDSLDVAMEAKNGRGYPHGRFFFECNRKSPRNQASRQFDRTALHRRQFRYSQSFREFNRRQKSSRMPIASPEPLHAKGSPTENLGAKTKKAPAGIPEAPLSVTFSSRLTQRQSPRPFQLKASTRFQSPRLRAVLLECIWSSGYGGPIRASG